MYPIISLAHLRVPQCGGGGVWGILVRAANVLPEVVLTPLGVVKQIHGPGRVSIGWGARDGVKSPGYMTSRAQSYYRRMPAFAVSDEHWSPQLRNPLYSLVIPEQIGDGADARATPQIWGLVAPGVEFHPFGHV